VTLNNAGRDPAVRTGDKYVHLDGADDDVLLVNGVLDIPTATSAWSCCIWYRSSSTASPDSYIFAGRKSSSGNGINRLAQYSNGTRLSWDTRDDSGNGFQQLQTNASGQANSTGSEIQMNDGRWHLITLVRGADKSKNIYIDARLAATGADTMGAGATGLDWAYLGWERTLNTHSVPCDIDEFVVWRTALTATDVSNLYFASVFNYEMVDDTSLYQGGPNGYPYNSSSDQIAAGQGYDDDLTYNVDGTTNDRDLFDFENTPTFMDSALCVAVKVRAKKQSPGTRNIAIVVKDAGTEYTGSDLALGLSYATAEQYYDVQPGGIGNWTQAAVDALQAGYKVR
jgi:hypothetical protein